MRKPDHGTPRKQGGLSLIPELWEAIDRTARLGKVPRNRVIETVLMREFGFEKDSQKTVENSQGAEPIEELAG